MDPSVGSTSKSAASFYIKQGPTLTVAQMPVATKKTQQARKTYPDMPYRASQHNTGYVLQRAAS